MERAVTVNLRQAKSFVKVLLTLFDMLMYRIKMRLFDDLHISHEIRTVEQTVLYINKWLDNLKYN